MLFLRFSKPHSLKWFHWLIVLASLVLTVGAWYFATIQVHQKNSLQYERNATFLIEYVKERMVLYQSALNGGVAFAEVLNGNIPYNKWLKFSSSLNIDKSFPGINGIGVIFNVSESDKETFTAKQKVDRPDWHMHPEHSKSEYWPITHIEPADINAKAVGLDMAFEENRYRSILKARDSGKAQVTAPIVLVQDAKKTPGFLFYVPFYKGGGTPNTLEKRRELIIGAIYAPFIMSKLMEGVLSQDNRQIALNISDESETLFKDNEEQFDPVPLFKSIEEINMYGRKWRFEMSSNMLFREQVEHDNPIVILIAGLVIDTMLFWLIIILAHSKNEAEKNNAYLAESRNQLNDAQRIMHLGSWSYDINTEKLEWSDEVYNIFELDKESTIPSYKLFLDAIHPDDASLVNDAYQKSLKEKSDYKIEHRIIMKTGQVKFVEERCWTQYDKKSDLPLKSYGTIHDISERKINELLLLEAKREADKANEEKSRFLANMSHELRTPMHAIVSFTNLGLKKLDDIQKVEGYFNNIKQSARRLTGLLNNLLDLSKLESGKTGVHFSLNNLTLCVATAVKELEGLSHAKDLTIDINTKEPFEAMFDNALMLQAIINLLSNAIKFSPIGDSISVEIYKGEQWINESNQAALSVIVSDHGIGIPEDELECIFDKFIQSSKTMTASGGTGLGLSIVKEIVHLHNGHIYAVSPLKDGELGSSFCMTIPMLQDTL